MKIINRLKYLANNLVHNLVVHPVLPFMPSAWAAALHDKHAEWTFGMPETKYDVGDIECLVSMYKLEGYSIRKQDVRYTVMDKTVGNVIESITILYAKQSTRGHYHTNAETYFFSEEMSDGLSIYLNGMENRAIGRVYIPPNVHHKVVNDSNVTRVFKCEFPVS